MNGFSFCVLNKDSNEITHVEHVTSNTGAATPQKQLEQITDAFNSNSLLKQPYNSFYATHSNKLTSFVPKPFFNSEQLGNYLQYNVKLLNNDFIAYDELESTEMVNVYIPFVHLNNFLFDKFGSFEYKHSSSVLVELLLKKNKNNTDTKFFVHVEDDIFQIIILKEAKLFFFNSFSFKSKEDFIYYILFTAEQSQLNPEKFELIFLGDIEEKSELYDIAFKYVRNISFFKNDVVPNFTHSSHADIVLLNQF